MCAMNMFDLTINVYSLLEHSVFSFQVSCPWEILGIDLTGKLPQTPRGFLYISTCTDYFTKWVEALPLKTNNASEVAQCLCRIFYRHGAPETIITDNRREIVNEVSDFSCRFQLLAREQYVTSYVFF